MTDAERADLLHQCRTGNATAMNEMEGIIATEQARLRACDDLVLALPRSLILPCQLAHREPPLGGFLHRSPHDPSGQKLHHDEETHVRTKPVQDSFREMALGEEEFASFGAYIFARLYGYVSGNPLSNTDLLGLFQVTITATISPFLVGPAGTLTFGYNHGQFNIGGWLGAGAGGSISINPDDLPCHVSGSFRSTRADGRIGVGVLGTDFSAQYGSGMSSTEFTTGVPFIKSLETGVSVENGQISTAPVTNVVRGGSVFLGGGAQWYF